MCDKGVIELVDDSYKTKQTKETKFIEDILAELANQYPPFSESEALVFPETENSPESLFLRKCLSTPETPSAQPPTAERTVKHPGDKCTHYLDLFQNLLRVMEEIKWFTKSTERKFEELEMTL